MRFALYEGEIVDIDWCLSQLSVIKYTEEMCLKYVRGLKEIENFLRKSYGSLMGIFTLLYYWYQSNEKVTAPSQGYGYNKKSLD